MAHYIFDADTLALMAEIEIPSSKPIAKNPTKCFKCGQGLTLSKCSYCYTENPMQIESEEEAMARTKKVRERWIHDQVLPTPANRAQSFIEGLRHLVKAQIDFMETEAGCTFTMDDAPTGGVFTIYGIGGWHRWIVTFSGEVCFSKHHALKEQWLLAETLGFRLW